MEQHTSTPETEETLSSEERAEIVKRARWELKALHARLDASTDPEERAQIEQEIALGKEYLEELRDGADLHWE